MAAGEIDDYLRGIEEPKRSTLEQLRRDIVKVIPDAEQCIAYGCPAFKVESKTVAGFAAFKNDLSYLPHCGSVFRDLADELSGYQMSAGALRIPVDQPLPAALVRKLIEVRIKQAFPEDLGPGRPTTCLGKGPVSGSVSRRRSPLWPTGCSPPIRRGRLAPTRYPGHCVD